VAVPYKQSKHRKHYIKDF